jgi:predicted dinucleotide-binding enzyme
MKIGILGTGTVEQTLAGALAANGDEVLIGTPTFGFKIVR